MARFNVKTFLFVLPLILLFLECKNIAAGKQGPRVINGILDLRNRNLSNSGLVRLNGEWEFYWHELLSPGDFNARHLNEGSGKYIIVPKRWDYQKNGNKNNSVFGYATYRLKILLKNKNMPLALRLPGIFSSYRLWADDMLLITSGTVGKTRQTSAPEDSPRIVFFNNKKEQITLTIEVSNFYDIPGGICFPITFGNAFTIHKEKSERENLEIFFFGAILFISIFHFGLFILRSKDKSLLFFGFFCLVIAVRTIFTGEHVLMNYLSAIGYEMQKKIEFFTLPFGAVSFCLFFNSQYPGGMRKGMLKFFIVSGAAYSLIISAFPLRVYTAILFFYQLIIISLCIYTIVLLLIAIYRKKEGAVIFITGFFILFLSVFMEILQDRLKIEVGFYIPFGMLVFIIAQAFILAQKYSRAFKETENYSIELEEKVRERTVQLEEANQGKTNFFINIAHETKTPLTLIDNYLDSYIKKYGLTNELKIMKNNFRQLLNTMVDFLDFEKIQKGRVVYNHDTVTNFSRILKNKIVLFRDFAKIKNIDLRDDIRENLFVKIDSYAIDRIINNIVENAIKYTSGGEISVRLNENKNKVNFIVEDTGIGLTGDQVKKIFEPFYQIQSDKKYYNGIGIGLNITKKILDSVGGKISVKSRINRGSVFTIELNRHHLTSNDIVGKEEPLSGTRKPNNNAGIIGEKFTKGLHNIFIVEDNIDLLSYLVENMAGKFNVYYALNGKDALEKIGGIPGPHLIISDVLMDQMDGFEFYENLLKDARYKKIPFIFLTAKTSKKDKLDGLKKGAVDYIYKPFVIEELIAKIRSILKIQSTYKKDNLLKIADKIYDFFEVMERKNPGNNDGVPVEHDSGRLYFEYDISKREAEILQLLNEGLEHKEIAGKLKISIFTVRTYIRRIYQKCNVNNKVDLLNIFFKKQ